LLEYLPNLDKLIVDWRIFLHETENCLLEPEEVYSVPETRELELYIGSKSTGINESGGEPWEFFSAIVEETGDLLAHLHLPFLESLFLRIDVNEPIPNEPFEHSTWDLFAERIAVDKWAKTLKRVDLVISFDLGEEPHSEVLEVNPSLIQIAQS
jgi:hypothetical protein